MGLQPIVETVSDKIPIFAKVLELFTGGFSVSSTGLDGVDLPAGSLIRVDESDRTASVVKSAKLAEDSSSSTVHRVVKPHYIAVGDVVGFSATAHTVTTIVASGDYDAITVATAIKEGATGDVLYVTSGIGTATPSVVANTISRYPTKIGGEVTALRRGTVYKNRINQPNVAGHLTDLPATIQLSDSY